MNTEFITDSRTEPPKEKYERLVPLLIAGAGYDQNAENKIVREPLPPSRSTTPQWHG